LARVGLAHRFFAYRLHAILFAALIILSAPPVVILDSWVESSAMEKEIASVTEKHLIIAQNLSGEISRYVIDVKEGFKVVAGAAHPIADPDGLKNLLRVLNFKHICIIDSRDRLVSAVVS